MDFQRVEREVPDVVTGLRDPNSTVAGRAVVDMSDDIHLYEPDAAPFLALTKEFRDKREVSQYEFKTLSKEPYPRALTSSAAYIAADASIVFSSGHGTRTRAYDLLLNVRTREVIHVTSIATDTAAVTRGIGSTAADIEAGDVFIIMGNAYEDGSRSGTMKSVKEDTDYNYTQILRKKYGWSGRQKNTKFYGGSDVDSERKAQGIEHAKDMEYAMLMGRRHSMVGSNGRLITTMGGVEFFLRSNVWDLNGIEPQERAFIEFLEEGMRYGGGGFQNGSKTKTLFCSSRWATVINRWAGDKVEYRPMDDVIGIKALRYQSIHGMVNIVRDVIFDEFHPDWALLVDLNHVRYAYHQGRDTVLVKNREDNDLDGSEEEWISDVSLDIELEGAHALLKGLPI